MKQKPKILDLNRRPGQPKRRKKVVLVFDEEKRRYLYKKQVDSYSFNYNMERLLISGNT